jgi:hypothetical protein
MHWNDECGQEKFYIAIPNLPPVSLMRNGYPKGQVYIPQTDADSTQSLAKNK